MNMNSTKKLLVIFLYFFSNYVNSAPCNMEQFSNWVTGLKATNFTLTQCSLNADKSKFACTSVKPTQAIYYLNNSNICCTNSTNGKDCSGSTCTGNNMNGSNPIWLGNDLSNYFANHHSCSMFCSTNSSSIVCNGA